MEYKIYDADGNLDGGDDELDDELRRSVNALDGWAEDEAGEIVYASPAYRKVLEQEVEHD